MCDKTFRMKKHLAYHKFSKHTEKESLQCDIDCIYMTSLHCVFTLSVFGCVEPLKKISGWVFLLNGLGLFRTTLCACRSFWGGAENCSLTGKLLWPAHLFRHFLRRVWCRPGVPFLISTSGKLDSWPVSFLKILPVRKVSKEQRVHSKNLGSRHTLDEQLSHMWQIVVGSCNSGHF